MELECRHKREEFIKSHKEESKEDLFKQVERRPWLVVRCVRDDRIRRLVSLCWGIWRIFNKGLSLLSIVYQNVCSPDPKTNKKSQSKSRSVQIVTYTGRSEICMSLLHDLGGQLEGPIHPSETVEWRRRKRGTLAQSQCKKGRGKRRA